MRYREELNFPIDLCRGGEPLHEQIARQVARAIEAGRVARGARLPSTRTLAETLGVSRGVVGAAYDLLCDRGYLIVRSGAGTFARPESYVAQRASAVKLGDGLPMADFTPGQLCVEAFPTRAWRAAWREVTYRVPEPVEPGLFGLPALRAMIAEQTHRAAGWVPSGHVVVLTEGVAAGLQLALAVLGVSGADCAITEPVLPELIGMLQADPPRPVRSDDRGAAVEELPAAVRVLIRSPLTSPWSAGRSREAARWLAAGGRLITVTTNPLSIPDGRLTAGHIVVGGFCDVLGPAMRLGFLLAPAELAHALSTAIHERDHPHHLIQHTAAILMRDGVIARQMRRRAALLATKRIIVAEALHRLVPLTFWNDATVLIGQEAPLAANRVRAAGIRLRERQDYQLSSQGSGLVLGYAHLPEPHLRRNLQRLMTVL